MLLVKTWPTSSNSRSSTKGSIWLFWLTCLKPVAQSLWLKRWRISPLGATGDRWVFYELLTGETLDESLSVGGNYLPVLDPAVYLVAPS